MNIQKVLYCLYILLLILGYFYIKNVLESPTVEITTKQAEEKATETRLVPVTLLASQDGKVQNYKTEMMNTDSVLKLLDFARTQGLSYEKISYRDGDKLDYIFGQKAPEGYEWYIVYNNQIVDINIEDTTIDKGGIYEIKLLKVPTKN